MNGRSSPPENVLCGTRTTVVVGRGGGQEEGREIQSCGPLGFLTENTQISCVLPMYVTLSPFLPFSSQT